MPGPVTGVSTRFVRLRAFAAALFLLLFFILGGDRRGADPAAHAAPALQPSPNICALFPSGPDYDVRPASGEDGGSYACQVYDLRPDHEGEFYVISVSNIGSAYGAQSKVQSAIYMGELEPGQPTWQTAGFGDPGYGFQYLGFEAATDTSERSARLVFARGCYFFSGDAGWWNDGRSLFNNDLTGVNTIAGMVDGALGSYPCPDYAGGSSTGGGTTQPATEVPTATSTTAPEAPSATPSATAEVDIQVDHIEVVQVIQTEDNEIPLVAGKNTVVRVFLKIDGKTDAARHTLYSPDATLTIWPEGKSEVPLASHNLYVSLYPGPAPSREKLENSLNFVVPPDLTAAGVFSLKVVANADHAIAETDYSNNEWTQPFEFVQRNGLRVGFVRIGYAPPGQSVFSWPQSDVASFGTILKKIFPVADVDLQYYEMPWRVRTTGLASSNQLGSNLLLYLREFYDRIEGDKPHVLIGWLSSDYAKGFEYGGLAEVAQPGTLGRVALAIDNPKATHYSTEVLAHEVAHDLGLEHTGTTGDSGDPLCRISYNTTRNYWPAEYQNSAAIRILGLDVAEMKLIPGSYYDIMSYCTPYVWISKFHYMRLFDQNVRPAQIYNDGIIDKYLIRGWGLIRSGAGQPRFEVIELPGQKTSAAPRKSGASISMLDFADSLFISGKPRRTAVLQREGEGSHCLRFLDAGGNAIYERCFEPNFTDPESLQPVDEAGFAISIPDPGAFTKVVLVRNGMLGEQEIASVESRGDEPNIEITSPSAGETWEGEHTISWKFDGSDDRNLRFDVSYSPDGQTSWYPLQVATYDTSYTFSTDEILPSDQTYIRVAANDGFRTTYKTVGPLTVPRQLNSPGSTSSTSGTSANATPTPQYTPRNLPFSIWLRLNWVPIVTGSAVLLAALLLIFARVRGSRRRAAASARAASAPYVPAAPSQPYSPPSAQQPPAPQYTPAQPTPFDLAMQEYARLRAALNNRQISPQYFSESVARLTVQDAQGTQWRIGESDGLWYFSDGRAWVRGR